MIFLDHWRTMFIALVEREGLVPQGQHTHSLLLRMLGLRRTLLTFLRRPDRRSVLNWKKWDVRLLLLQVMEGFETVEGVMEAIGNGARKDRIPPKANVAFPFKASNFGQMMEIY